VLVLLKEGDGNTIFAQIAFDDGDVEKVQLSGAGACAFGLSKARNIRENVGGKTLVMLASTKDKHFAGLWVRATPLLENAFADADLAGIVSLLPSMDDHPMLKAISSLMGYSAPCHPRSTHTAPRVTQPLLQEQVCPRGDALGRLQSGRLLLHRDCVRQHRLSVCRQAVRLRLRGERHNPQVRQCS
jgi:hypothetical protein